MTKPAQKIERPPETRPTASVTVEPVGARGDAERAHAVRLHLPLSHFDERLADRRSLIGIAQTATRALGQGDIATYFDVLAKDKVIGIEATLTCPRAPDGEAIQQMRQALTTVGYQVTVKVLRECDDDGCTTTASIDGSRGEAAPNGWFSVDVCGKHGYRTCETCGSVYVMTSANASGQAPSLHCEVCGSVLVEWGGSKVWTAELVTRGQT